MVLFDDRRQRGAGKIYDIGSSAPPAHDPSQGLQGWASTIHDVKVGKAATLLPDMTRIARTQNVLPGQMNAPRTMPQKMSPYDARPSIVSPAEQRASVRPAAAGSRVDAWSNGSRPASQTVVPGAPMRVSGQAAQTVLPYGGRRVATGPSFMQRAARRMRPKMGI